MVVASFGVGGDEQNSGDVWVLVIQVCVFHGLIQLCTCRL